MKKILKLSLVSLCATGAVVSAQAHHDKASASASSDQNLVVTEPAGADNSADTSYTGVTGWQGTYQGGTAYAAPMQGQPIYEASGAAIGAPHMVTGRQQDCYADCILKQYQLGKGAARVTDEHYYNNVPADRLYAQYPASGAMYQNYAYNTSYSSQPMASSSYSSSTTIHSPRPAAGWSGSQGLWYAPDGRVYNSQGVLVRGGASGSVSEAAGAGVSAGQSSGAQSGYSSQSSQSATSGSQSSATQSGSLNEQSSSSAQPSATQSGTSGEQSSTELKGSQSQKGSATSEAAGAQPSTSSSTESATQPSTSNESSTQPSSTSTSPDQSSTQSSTGTSPSEQGMTDKVRSTLKTDQTLSPISSNVTVQDQNGKVALNGTVKSEAERQQVVSKAEEVAGSGNVIDNLQVQSDSNSSSNPNSNSNP